MSTGTTPVPATPPRATRLTALVSEAESAVIARKAEAAGLSVSAFLRECALGDEVEAMTQIDGLIDHMAAALDSANEEIGALLARLDGPGKSSGRAA